MNALNRHHLGILPLVVWLLLYAIALNARSGEPLRACYYDSRINSLEVTIKNPQGELHRAFPYFSPSQGEALEIAFDFVDDAPAPSLYYTLQYFDVHWHASDLSPTDTYRGLRSGQVQQPTPSGATKVNYWHYKLLLNEKSNPFPKLSGNWRILFHTLGNEDDPVLMVSFVLLEDATLSVEASISEKTQREAFGAYQEVSTRVVTEAFDADAGRGDLTVVVLQNGRSDNASLAQKTFAKGEPYVDFTLAESALFEGGSEYTAFELLGEGNSNMGVAYLDSYQPITEVELLAVSNGANKVYAYRDDVDGRLLFRAPSRSLDPATEADYYYVTFTFLSPLLAETLYLSGEAFDPMPLEDRQLHYSSALGGYRTTLLLKGGYYSYQILGRSEDSSRALSSKMTVGSHYQTTNQYTILVYYRGFRDSYDRLVATCELANH